jgi:RNA polymerase sigma-B factor
MLKTRASAHRMATQRRVSAARRPRVSHDADTPLPDDSGSDLVALDGAAYAYADAAADLRGALRTDLVERAAPVARRLARRYRGRGESLEDLEQVAVVGLLKAVEGYDPGRGPFSPYFLATASGELKKHFRDRGWTVRVPRRVQDLVGQVIQASARLSTDRGRWPSLAELAEEVGVAEAEVSDALASTSAYRPASLNAVLSGGEGTELIETLGTLDPDLGLVDDRLTVAELLCRLPPRERQMLALRFYGNRTQSEIAESMGISQMHASRLLSQTLAWLRDAFLSDDPVHWKAGRRVPDSDRLRVETEVEGAAVVVRLGGEFDRDTADQARRALSAACRLAPVEELRVDLTDVPFVDAAAAATLIASREAASRAGMRLRLVGARRYVAQTLATAGLWPYLGPG